MITITTILSFIASNWQLATLSVAAIWEILFRTVPTEKDWTIINTVKKFLDKYLQNNMKKVSK